MIKLFSNRVVLKGTITTDLTTTGVSWASFGYSLTSGDYTDVIPDMVLLICATDDITQAANTFYGRVRLAPSSSIIYSNESSVNFSPGATFYILDSYYPQYRLSRPSTNDPQTAVELFDYDQPYSPMLPAIVGLPTAIGGYPDPGSSTFRWAFDISQSFAANSGASISSYAYSFPSGSVAAGATNTPYVVMDFDPGEQWGLVSVTDSNGQTLYRHVGIQVLDDTDNPPDTGFGTTIKISSTIDQGYTMTSTAFAGVDNVLNNTFAMAIRCNEQFGDEQRNLWGGSSAVPTGKALTSNTVTITADNDFEVGQQAVVVISDSRFDGTYTILSCNAFQFTYHKVHADIGSTGASGLCVVNPRNVDFVGWFQRESDPVDSDNDYAVISTAEFTFVGLGPRMAKIVAELLPITSNSSPSQCGQIKDLTPWRLYLHYLSRYTTIANLSDLLVDDTTTAYAFPAIPTVSGSVLSNLSTIGKQTNTFIVFSPEGTISFNRSAEFLTQFQRGSLVTVANWEAQDAISITREYEPDPSTGRIDGDAAFYNPSNGQVTVYTSRAPGTAQGEAPGNDTLSTQILLSTSSASAALDDLEARVGTQLLINNNSQTLKVIHPGSYASLPFICSRSQLYTWTLDLTLGGSSGVNRIDYDTDTDWWIESTALTFDSDSGGFTVEIGYRFLVPVPDPGDNTTQVAPGEVPVSLPDFGLPAFNFDFPELSIPDVGLTTSTLPPAAALPPKGKIATFTGQELLIGDDDKVALLRNFINLTTPQSTDITPSTVLGTFIQGAISPFFTNSAIPGHLLENDSANSLVSYNTNIAAPGAAAGWVDGASQAGTYKVLRETGTADTVLIYSPNQADSTTSSLDLDLTATPGGFFVFNDGFGNFLGTWVAATGWETTVIGGGDNRPQLHIQLNLTSTHITSVETFYATGNGASGGTRAVQWDGSSPSSSGLNNGTGTFDTTTTVNSDAVTQIQLFLDTNINGAAGSVITRVIITGTDIEVQGGAGVLASTDNGATFGAFLRAGDAVTGSIGGFDVQRAGGTSYAAIKDAVARASSLGGSYGSWYSITGGAAQACCCIIPYFSWSGVNQVSAANPDVIIALTALDGSSRSLLWIEGGATPGTVHDITPTAGIVFDSPNCVTISYNHHIAVFGKVSGTYHLYVTTNQGSTWHDRGALSNAYFIRDRRNDNRAKTSGTNKGQLFIASNSEAAYSSTWDNASGSVAGMWPRITPFAPKWLDAIF